MHHVPSWLIARARRFQPFCYLLCISVASALAGGAPAETHWAFKPLASPAIPSTTNLAWAKTDVDRFILAKLEEQGLRPASPADKRNLLRRASFDVIGLPPTIEQIETFLADSKPGAFERLLDSLL